jgi:hypothetical protein
LYHVVGRGNGFLRIFNTSYDYVDLDKIRILRNDSHSISFTDDTNEYFFNRSKSVLIKRFIVPQQDYVDVPVSIILDPLPRLLDFFQSGKPASAITSVKEGSKIDPTPSAPLEISSYSKGSDYVILPLYSTRGSTPVVPPKSGLNQWNAGGRPRDPNEVYIPIPRKIHQVFPGFFPPRDEHFILILPDGQRLSAKVCQEGSKALMSTHNADLGKWLLRHVLRKAEGDLVTMNDLNRFGIDSVRIINRHSFDSEGRKLYSIEFTTSDYEPYSEFSGDY